MTDFLNLSTFYDLISSPKIKIGNMSISFIKSGKDINCDRQRNVCICMYIYIHMCVCMCVICITCGDIYVCVHKCIYVCNIYMPVCVFVCIHGKCKSRVFNVRMLPDFSTFKML